MRCAHGRRVRVSSGIAVGIVAGVVLVPLLAVGWTLVDPPMDPLRPERDLASAWLGARGGTLVANSALLSVAVGLFATGLGGALAVAHARLAFPGRRALGVASLLPLAIPSYLAAATLAGALGPSGWIGAPAGGFRPSGLPFAAIVLAAVTAPVAQLVVGAALARIGAAEEEAARTLGAAPWRAFRVATLPALRPALAYALLLSALYALSDFGAVAVLDLPVLTWRLYQAVAGQDLPRAAALGLALIALTLPLLLVARGVHGGVAARAVANPRPPARVRPGGLVLGGVYAAHGVVLGVGLIVPLATLLGWVYAGWARGLPFADPWTPIAHSAGIAALGAVVTVLLAMAPAVVVARGRGGLGAAVQGGVWLASALPGVLLAFGWILAALALVRLLGLGSAGYGALLGSGALLLLGYATRFLAEAFAPLAASLARVDPRQVESARVLGASAARIRARVVLPAVAPGVAAGALLAFVAILKELPVTLLLGGPTGLSTLAFRVWDRYNEALWHDAGLAGLILAAVALVAVTATLRWRRHV